MNFRDILKRGAGRVVQEGESVTEAGVNTAKAVAKEAVKDIAKQAAKRVAASLAAAAAPYAVPILVVVLPLVIILVLMLAVGSGTAGQLTGVNNPREPGDPGEQLPPGDIPPPATGDCAPLANAPRLTYWHDNDRQGIPQGQIRRVRGYEPDDPVGELVPIHPSMCNMLIGLTINSGIPVLVTAALNDHARYVQGSNRISRHWVGAAIDIDPSEAAARYAFDNRAALGIDQIITGRWRQYNVNNGQPYQGYSEALLRAHMGHTHIGW